MRVKHKARWRRHSHSMASQCNAVIGAHRRSRGQDIKQRARLPAPVDCVAALAKGGAIACALRLATNAGPEKIIRGAAYGDITLKEH